MKYIDAGSTAEKISNEFEIPMSELCDVFADIPAADVQPVKHGEWEYIRNVKLSGTIKLCECNQCHNKIFGGLSYCGNCGARMDLGDEKT